MSKIIQKRHNVYIFVVCLVAEWYNVFVKNKEKYYGRKKRNQASTKNKEVNPR